MIIKDLTAEQAYKLVDNEIAEAGLAGVKGKDVIDIINGYVGGGYSVFTDQDSGKILVYTINSLNDLITDQLITISASTGIVLDHTYTMKAVKGLIGELHSNPRRFKGKRILYIHTGNVSSDMCIECPVVNCHLRCCQGQKFQVYCISRLEILKVITTSKNNNTKKGYGLNNSLTAIVFSR